MTRDCVFAIDFTNQKMAAAFVSLDGEEEGAAGFDLVDFLAGDTPPVDKLLALLVAKAKSAGDRVRATAVSLACDLDRDRRRVLCYPDAHWLNGQPLAEILEDALGVPVVLERRGLVRLCYDRIMLGLPEDGVILGCYVDTHYDSAIWHRGAPIIGHNGHAGNIAHMAIHDREDNCFCGRMGCVDLYGAGTRLRQMHSMIFPDTPMEEIFERHGDHPIMQDYLAMMAYPIAIEGNILDPDFFILGGGIPAMRGFPRKLLEEQIRTHRYQPDASHESTFLPSPSGDAPGVVVAAQYGVMKLGLLG